jgi:putative aldouronate transport system permease protein
MVNTEKMRDHRKNKLKGNRSDRIMNVINIVVMLILAFTFFYPFGYTLVISLCNVKEASELGFKLFVRQPTLESYKIVFQSSQIWVALGNTIFRTVAGAALSLIVTFCGAVALSRRDLPGRNIIQTIIIITMFFSGGLIPSYLLISNLGMLNSYWSLLIPGLTSCWFVIICRNFIQSLPPSFEESALVDGANPILITFRIILPLSMPIVVVLLLMFGVGHWNSYFDAMIYNRDPNLEVLQQLLRRILIDQSDTTNIFKKNALSASNEFTTPQTIKAATVIIATVPIVCVYPFLQKYLVKGIMIGGLKG